MLLDSEPLLELESDPEDDELPATRQAILVVWFLACASDERRCSYGGHDAECHSRNHRWTDVIEMVISPELVLLSEPLELSSESADDDDDASESEDEEESESDELELSCRRLLRGTEAPCSLG